MQRVSDYMQLRVDAAQKKIVKAYGDSRSATVWTVRCGSCGIKGARLGGGTRAGRRAARIPCLQMHGMPATRPQQRSV